jgi:hypothetical protein
MGHDYLSPVCVYVSLMRHDPMSFQLGTRKWDTIYSLNNSRASEKRHIDSHRIHPTVYY